MRAIKFRAFHQGQMRQVFTYEQDSQRVSLDGAEFFSIAEVPLMQFTGLHDKNGKEIYEGDIVRAVYRESEGGGWYSDHKVKGAVYFDKDWGVKFDCRDHTQRTADTHWYSRIPHEKASDELKKSHWSDSSMPREYNSVEVIGNIYENPELLTV